jgi:cysteine desulfurase / selenocysteine lyase
MINIEQVRLDTPAVKNIIHFNNAGSSLMPQSVLQSVIDYLQAETERGGYEVALERTAHHERAYSAIAELINAQPHEIATIENATRAWDMAFYSIPFQHGDRILTAQAEYASNYMGFLQAQKRHGVEIVVIPDDAHGQIDVQALEHAIDERVKLIAITHIPSTGGLINPAEEVGRIAKKHGILYLLDACQSVGQLVIDVEKIGCDFLSATGRKFLRAPRGTGFLYARQNTTQHIEPVIIDLHSATWTGRDTYAVRDDARRFENWETNYSTKVGLAVATDYALKMGMPNIQTRVQALANHLREQLSHVKGATVRDLGVEKCGIVTFTLDGQDSYAVKNELSQKNINVSVSPVEYSRLDMEARGLKSMVRASVHYYNTEEEIARFCEQL